MVWVLGLWTAAGLAAIVVTALAVGLGAVRWGDRFLLWFRHLLQALVGP